MNKQDATEFMQEVLKLTAQLNIVAAKTEQLAKGPELHEMRRNIGNMMAACDENLFRPILRQYPELDPHRS